MFVFYSTSGHRFEDPKGMRRSKIKGKFWPSFLKKEDSSLFGFYKKKYEHEPHEVCIPVYLI